ncbi:hypothetical protein SBOR_7921 [Sclerotinia borealis F-4128]|uniref:PAN2-PAN3 deadenylation complex subunit PAN3 n=1 Tax=Sclerotinia borealis (strain F-4128) TaxID=1432307 RepID=W9C4K7_SCLBF|nr:hypothetical protein SBOR_7921 [Sclerotinia borealis F-4128]
MKNSIGHMAGRIVGRIFRSEEDKDKAEAEDRKFLQQEEDQKEPPNFQDQLALPSRRKKTRKNHRGSGRGSVSNESLSILENGTKVSVSDEIQQSPDSFEPNTTPRTGRWKKQLRNISQTQPPIPFEESIQSAVAPEPSLVSNGADVDVDIRESVSIGKENSQADAKNQSSLPRNFRESYLVERGSSIPRPLNATIPTLSIDSARSNAPAPVGVSANSKVSLGLNVPAPLNLSPFSTVSPPYYASPGVIESWSKNAASNKRQGSDQSSTEAPSFASMGRLEKDDIDTPNQQPIIYSKSKERPTTRSSLFKTDPDNDRPKKTLNVDSPAFTPAAIPAPNKGGSITSQAASAAPFTPRGLTSGTATPTAQLDPEIAQFNPSQTRDFTPHNQNYDLSQNIPTNGATPENPYDHFSMANVSQAIPTSFQNHYSEDVGNLATSGAAFYQGQPSYNVQPLNYHFYAPIGPHKEDLANYQRSIHDLFLSDRLREELQRKSEASLQVMPNATLPTLGVPVSYHSLVALDTTQNRSTTVFGCPSWVYKATATRNGKHYCLRRLEGYHLTNEKAIQAVKKWQTDVNSAGVVSFIDAFTTREFKDGSSLIIVTNYHPLSKTLLEVHFPTTNINRYGNRPNSRISEETLWAYIAQITIAIKAVHDAKYAVRCMHLSKVILTDKNRIRLNACSVFDIIHYEQQRPIKELQDEDLHLFGTLMLSLATVNASITPQSNPQVMQTNVDGLSISRIYSVELIDTIRWLLTPPSPTETKDLQTFMRGISDRMASALDSSLQANDGLTSDICRELENARLVRLMAKLGNINERPEYDNDTNWSEHGERYILKLFRDYVFHPVDAEGRPVTDMAWMLKCLNKLDAGTEEKIQLTSRDGENSFIVSYKELKKQVMAAWGDLQKPGKRGF